MIARALGNRFADETRALTADDNTNSSYRSQIGNTTILPIQNTSHLRTLPLYQVPTASRPLNNWATNSYGSQLTFKSDTVNTNPQLVPLKIETQPSFHTVFTYGSLGQTVTQQYLSKKYQISPLSLNMDGVSSAGGNLYDSTQPPPTDDRDFLDHTTETPQQTQDTPIRTEFESESDSTNENQENTSNKEEILSSNTHPELEDDTRDDSETESEEEKEGDEEEEGQILAENPNSEEAKSAQEESIDRTNEEPSNNHQDNSLIVHSSTNEPLHDTESDQNFSEGENANSTENPIDISPPAPYNNPGGNNGPFNPFNNNNNWNPNNHFRGMPEGLRDFLNNAWNSIHNFGAGVWNALNFIGQMAYWGAIASTVICATLVAYKILDIAYKATDLIVVKPLTFCYSSIKGIYDYFTNKNHSDHHENGNDSYVIIYKNGKKSHIEKLGHNNDLDEESNVQALGQDNFYDELFEV